MAIYGMAIGSDVKPRPVGLSDRELAHWIVNSKSVRRPSGCIEWQGAVSTSGYGNIKYEDGFDRPHRVVLYATKGMGLPGMYATHICGNKLCVNPDHLRWATPQENCADDSAHGRRHATMKLTPDDVREIRKCLAKGERVGELGVAVPGYSTVDFGSPQWQELPIPLGASDARA